MNFFQKLFSRQCYRSMPFWLLILTALYAIGGFYALPKIIHNTLVEQIDKQLGWQSNIKKISLNPFLFTLSIEQLVLSEKNTETLSFKKFHADFELRSIIEGAFTFKNIELVEPKFNLSIAKDGTTNLQRALAKKPSEKNDNEANKPFVMPKLLFDIISVKNGAFTATDHSHQPLIKHQLNPISFKLDSFSTYIEKGGDYQLHISMGNGQSLDWSGNLSVAPISSQGSLNIKGIQAHRLWPYIAPFSPYTLLQSNVDVEANYALSYVNNQFQLSLDNTFVTLHDSKVALSKSASQFVSIKQIKAGPSQFNLTKQSINIEKILVDNIKLDLIRNKNGSLALLAPLDAYFNKDTSSAPLQSTDVFNWAIHEISISNSEVDVSDHSIQNTANIRLHQINAELFNLDHKLSNKQPFTLSYQVEKSGINRFSGHLVAQPFALESDIQLSKIPLKIMQPYLSEFTHIKIQKGDLSVTGKSTVNLHKKRGLQGNFKGTLGINDFDSRDTLIKRRLLGWKNLQVSPINLNLSPLSVEINTIKLDKPYSRLVITEDRKINLSLLMKNKKQNSKKPTQSTTAISIDQVQVNDGSAYFADLSLRPQFGTSIQNLNGLIKGLSSNNLESADVRIKGTVEEYGKVLVAGKINPLSGDLYTDININFDKIELTTLTPYAGRYAGYVIDKGKLSLILNYKIAQGILDGQNRLILDQFELGEAVASEESLDLPIKLALALFKNSDGVIDISLPTKGDMNAPDFEISGLIMKALINVISKAVTSPFTLLANIAGGDEESLNSVKFDLASSSLDEQQLANLKSLSDLLKKRPQLILEIRVNVDSDQERLALKRLAVNNKLDLKSLTQAGKIKVMEQTITADEGTKNLEVIKRNLVAKQDPEQPVDSEKFAKQYQQQLFQHLVNQHPIASLQLTELAQQRISTIKNALIKVNQVENSQVFALNPSLSASAENGKISTVFNLTSK